MEMNYYVYRQIVQTTKRCDLETVYQIAEQCVAQKELWYTEAVLEENPLMHFRELFKIVTEETVEIDGNASKSVWCRLPSSCRGFRFSSLPV